MLCANASRSIIIDMTSLSCIMCMIFGFSIMGGAWFMERIGMVIVESFSFPPSCRGAEGSPMNRKSE